MNSNLSDGLNLLSKITLKRAINATKVLGSYYWSKWRKTPNQKGLPISLAFEPTTSCNLRCPECPSGLRSFTRPTGMMSAELFKKIIDDLSPTLLYLTFYFQGEPYLHPRFLELVKYAANKKIYTATSTNGHYLTDENAEKTVRSGLDRLIISIDGTTQETYDSYRIGGVLSKVLEGTKKVVEWKEKLQSKTPHLVFQFLVVKPNEHQIGEVEQLAKKLGVNEVGLKTAQIYDYESGSPLIPSIDKYSRYKKENNGTYSIKNKMANSCWKMWNSCVITWDGLVVPCCFDKDAHNRMGNVTQASFKEVWKSTEYNQFRQLLLSSRKNIDMCKNCSEGTKVWA